MTFHVKHRVGKRWKRSEKRSPPSKGNAKERETRRVQGDVHSDDRRVTPESPINDALGQREKENRERVDDRVGEEETKRRVRAENKGSDKSENGDAAIKVERETAQRRETTSGFISKFGPESDVAGRRARRTPENEKAERQRRDVRKTGG